MSWREKVKEREWKDQTRKGNEYLEDSVKEEDSGKNSKVEKNAERGTKKREERKAVLLAFAKANNFDPLVADCWYYVSRKQFLLYTVCIPLYLFPLLDILNLLKGGRGVVKYYDNSLIEAIIDLFPELSLEKSKFASVPRIYFFFVFVFILFVCFICLLNIYFES